MCIEFGQAWLTVIVEDQNGVNHDGVDSQRSCVLVRAKRSQVSVCRSSVVNREMMIKYCTGTKSGMWGKFCSSKLHLSSYTYLYLTLLYSTIDIELWQPKMPSHRPTFHALRRYAFLRPVRIPVFCKSGARPFSRIRSSLRFLRTPTLYFVLPSPQSLHFHTATAYPKGITPDSESPAPKELPGERITQPTNVTEEGYHELSNRYLDGVLAKLEEMQESREDLEVEYSVRT